MGRVALVEASGVEAFNCLADCVVHCLEVYQLTMASRLPTTYLLVQLPRAANLCHNAEWPGGINLLTSSA
jgi:hypothetical protein